MDNKTIYKLKHARNRLKIPSIGVDAPLQYKQVELDGTMQDPDIPDVIVYHDLSRWPTLGGKLGKEGNAVFTGHVDSGAQYCNYGTVPPPCHAVLWDLDKVEKNDNVIISYNNHEYNYRVISKREYFLEKGGWLRNIRKTKRQIITIISCSGEFDIATLGYKSQLIVKAERVK